MRASSRWISIALLILASLDLRAGANTPIAPFSVSYEVIFRGLNAGTASLTLQRENGDRWRYESRNEARGLFRLAFPGEITQTSVFRIDNERVIPLQYRADDGTESTDKDIALNFDHTAGKATGVAERSNVNLAIESGVQDPMSVQIAVMQALIARGVIGDFRAPDILRFGFTPLYIGADEVARAVEILARIMSERRWDRPEFRIRSRVT